jgi:diguanylate cyclase (GGDEF)-like protein/PAS domain S-box-containing protein
MASAGGGSISRSHLGRLILVMVAAILAVVWALGIAYSLAERDRVLERAHTQLAVTVATLADLNELAAMASSESLETRNAQRTAAIWRALLQYPTASIWVESDGVVSAGQAPGGDVSAFIVTSDARTRFTVHAALPRADVLVEWRSAAWREAAVLALFTVAFLILARLLSDALRRRAAAERETAAAEERATQLALYRAQLEATVAQRTSELSDANSRLNTELVERKAAETALREHDAMLKAVTRSASELLGAHSFDDAIPVVLAMIGQTVAVSRVLISTVAPDSSGHLRSRLVHEWAAPGLMSLGGDRGFQDIDLNTHLPQLVAPMLGGSSASAFVEEVPASTRPLFDKFGFRSLLQLPVMIGGQLWGSLSFVASTPERRQWSWAETDTLETLAGLIGVAVARGQYVKELADANVIVQNSPTILYRLRGEPSLPMIYVSHNVTKFGHDPEELLGTPNWSRRLIHPDDQAKVGAAMTRLRQDVAEAFSIEFRLVSGPERYRWVDNRYTPIRDKNGRLVEVEGIIIDITERKAAEEKIALLARTDSLTGLANRATFNERLAQAFAATRRGGPPFAVISLDVDHFKNVNDTLGHPAGDQLLCLMAQRLKETVRETDVVARLGGDEFAILQSGITDVASAGTLAAKILDQMRQPCVINGNELHLTVSIGISPFVPGTPGPDAMMSQADMALYQAKEEGRNRYRFHSKAMDDQMHVRVALADELREAVEHDQFLLLYQPQVELRSGRIVGMEALLRWRHPTRGVLYPGQFLPVADQSGLIVPIGRWVLDSACRQMKSWQETGLAPRIIAVNVSLEELKGGRDFVAGVRATLDKHGVAPERLEVDVTEATLAHLTWTQSDVLSDLRALGVNVAIDDFGTKYSSFEYLRTYSVNHLKIAQEFVERAVRDRDHAATIRSIIGLAREFGIEIIAEGVETREQRDMLLATGSAEAQGFYFSKPVEVERATSLLRQNSIEPNQPPNCQSPEVALAAGNEGRPGDGPAHRRTET